MCPNLKAAVANSFRIEESASLSYPIYSPIFIIPSTPSTYSIRRNVRPLQLYSDHVIQRSCYTVLQLYSAPVMQCSSYTALILYSAHVIQCSSYTALQLYSASVIQRSSYTALQLYSAHVHVNVRAADHLHETIPR